MANKGYITATGVFTEPDVEGLEIIPIKDAVLVSDMYFGEQVTTSGLIIMDDDGKDRGIHPRWSKVYAIGPHQKADLKVNDWVLVNHGRWSRGIKFRQIDQNGNKIKDMIVRKVDPRDILLKTSEELDPEKFCMLGL